MSSEVLRPHKSLEGEEEEEEAGFEGEVATPDVTHRVTPVKRRRVVNLVQLRGQGGMTSSSVDLGAASCHSLSHPLVGITSSSSLGHGRRSRTPLTDLDSKFVAKSGLCVSLDSGDGGGGLRGGGVKITHLTGSGASAACGGGGGGGGGGSGPPGCRDDSVSRFPRLDQCAHFHYEYVELPPVMITLVSEELKPLSQGVCGGEDTENRSLLVQVSSLGRSWVIRRTYDNFRFLDKQLHRCCYDRKYSQLKELPPEENLPGDEKETAIENTLSAYLRRLSDVAGSLITCGPVLSWLELDNRGHRLIVTDDSDINTPAVAAAYVVKRYTAQASDEISFEVGDMISVIDMPPPEESIWWRGKRGFQVGFFPCECVQVIGDKVPQAIHPQALTLPPQRSSSIPPPQGSQHQHAPLQSSASVGSANEPMKPVLRKHGKLIAFFRSFILSRPSRRKLKQSGILRERVFGCDLAEHLLNSGHEIPMVLKCCAEFIESHGAVDGIYRLSGITSNIQKLRNAFDEERVPDLYGDESILQDIHCVSSVLKMYFRELPNPLLTYQLYDKFVTAVMQNEEVRLLHVRDVVQQLPPPHYRTLEYLIQHLARIAALSGNTGMTPRNIAIVWAPNLLRSKDLEKGGVAALQDVGTQAVVTEYLVRYVDLIFSDKIPLFSASTNGMEGTPKKLRPKSLAISTPTKLLSIDEARSRALATIKSDQKYIEVGGGPQSLPKTYHTVIDLPSRKGGSLKQKKSPLGWKTLFSKNKHQRKASTPNEISLNVSDPAVTETDVSTLTTRRLRPVKSVESLVSTPASLHSNRNSQVIDQLSKQESSPAGMKGRRGSVSSEGSSIPSPRTHNRSVSHDSYFNLLERNEPAMESSSGALKEERESDTELSPESSKIFLDISELNLDFNTSEAEMKIFSEDDTLKSTSVEDTLSRSTVDIEENASIGSDIMRSKENVNSREKRSLKDKLKKRFTSPNTHRKETGLSDSSEESRSNNSLKRASSVIKEKLVQALSPETSRKKVEGSGNAQLPSPGGSPKLKHKKAEDKDSLSKEIESGALQQPLPCESSLSPTAKDSNVPNEISEEKERVSIESALIDPELLDKITRMRVSPSVSASEVSSVSLAEATVSDNESFTLGSSSVNGSIGTDGNKDANASDNGATVPQSQLSTPCTPPVTIVSDPQFQEEIYKRELPLNDEKGEVVTSKVPKSSRDRPSSLLGIPSSDACGLGSALTSPETPQGDSTFLEIQYHPLSDTTEPSTPSESHFAGNLEGDDTRIPPQHSSPLSPDLSSSSADDPIENGPLYENVELSTSLSPHKLSVFEAFSNNEPNAKLSKITPDAETPTAEESELEYENIQYSALEQSYYEEDSNIFDSDSVTPCYENLQNDFPLDIDHTETASAAATYENVDNPCDRGDEQSGDGSEYEEYSFKEPSNYENVEFSGQPEKEKTEAEIEGEVVYQQVKYLRKSIQEVNEILSEPDKTATQLPQFINISISQPLPDEKRKDDKENDAGDSECLDSPVTPSSSSLITEVLVLPSFSSPTESTTEDASSSDASESQSSPKTPQVQTTSPVREKPPSSNTSLTPMCIPSLSPPSPEVTGVVPVAVTCTSSKSQNLVPSPWPRQRQGHVWPPIPKPRNLPSLNLASPLCSPTSSSSSPSSSSSDSPRVLLKTPTEATTCLNYPSQLKNVVHIVNVPCSNERTIEQSTTLSSSVDADDKKSNDFTSGKVQPLDGHKDDGSGGSLDQDQSDNCDTPVYKEDEAQKRERIEKYKEERRSFLREKYKSESFKGEKDDMLLRLKQKATSPSRQDEGEENVTECPEKERGRSLFVSHKVIKEPSGSKPDTAEIFLDQVQTPPSNKRFQSNSVKIHTDSKAEKCAKDYKIKGEPLLHRSISEDSKVLTDKNLSASEKESGAAYLSSKTNTRTFSDCTFHSTRDTKLDDDINVKERVAIWSRHESSSSFTQKRESVPTTSLNPKATPPKLRKVQNNYGAAEYDSQLKNKVPKLLKDDEKNAVKHRTDDGRRLSGSGKPPSPVQKTEKSLPLTNHGNAPTTTTTSAKYQVHKTSPETSAKKPILISQKSETDLLKEHPLLKARSCSIGTGLGSATSGIRCSSSSQQKRIKDMKALFEKENPSKEHKPVLVRSTRDAISN